ncbi:MAG: hypothetical protein HRU72_07520 [Planctomycetia bacterium]|uniref:Uncharacterized protein n=1 Tax=Candidatus Brocadia sapporoensis TaxID=392547 RepID=A0A1V6M0C7_9BACT|nr:hypothetical protein [Candidatus Brocadia sapporoensis]MDG6005988.1 hypothetical protein [Candidatus Brocadia sp.]OQD45815.1 hypothetical protein BIY37_06345 [Candidatus Brocadia sapporoensis]QOJ06403.1 MAG: hypothetical protein HRU72_07520 [Planctomycetia bacterium]HQU31904.1 hypothetical protein [Candidatus Brocadia sapporoensis]
MRISNINKQQVTYLANRLLMQGDFRLRADNLDAAKKAYQQVKDVACKLSVRENTAYAIACINWAMWLFIVETP